MHVPGRNVAEEGGRRRKREEEEGGRRKRKIRGKDPAGIYVMERGHPDTSAALSSKHATA